MNQRSSAKSTKSTKAALSVQAIVLLSVLWATIALLFFLLFSVTPSGQERPEWYGIMTYILEEVAFLGAALLCLRNWRSSSIVSGRGVWLAIGLGLSSYFIGNLFLAYWEVGLKNSPEVSPGDFFFILTYIFLGWGMLQAVLSKQLNLTKIQWLILAGIAVVGIAIALFFAPSSEELAPEATPPALESPSPSATPTVTLPTAKSAPGSPSPFISPAPAVSPSPSTPEASPASPEAPAWAKALEAKLEPLAGIVTWLYIVGDIILVVMATTLLLAFWGGRFSLSWRFIAAAAFSYYIADIWFNYAVNFIPDYQTGALPEVFWIFSGCLFAIGAALEYDLSTRRRTTRRRT